MPTIALVDDDRNILASVSIALESEGYRVMTYTDGYRYGYPDGSEKKNSHMVVTRKKK